MKTIRTVIVFAIVFATSSVLAEPLKVGGDIDKAKAEMKGNNYDETGLAMAPIDKSNELMFWIVDEGVLIATFSVKERKILSLSFWVADDRARSERQEFSFPVKSYDPDTGVMTLQMKKPKGK